MSTLGEEIANHEAVTVKAWAGKVFRVFLQRRTLLNLAYLGASACTGFTYTILLTVMLSVSWGLTMPNIHLLMTLSLNWIDSLKIAGVILGGLLMVPLLAPVLQLPVVLEQLLANWLLGEKVPLDLVMFTRQSPFFKPWLFYTSLASWKRVLFILLRIPVGAASFWLLFYVLIPAVSMLGMPCVYLVGFHNLIIGPWRMDTFGKSLIAFCIAMAALPLTLLLLNGMAAACGWLARNLLADR